MALDDLPTLHHIGIERSQVPEAAVLVEGELARELPVSLSHAVQRREYRTGQIDGVPGVVVCVGFLGSPSATIVLEELARAGVRRAVAVGRCWCPDCEPGASAADGNRRAHGVVVPYAATREEGTSLAYAPLDFPAAPDRVLVRRLRAALAPTESHIVRTVDVPPIWQSSPVAAWGEPGLPLDLFSSALMIVAAARQVALASVVLGADVLYGDPARVSALMTDVARLVRQEVA